GYLHRNQRLLMPPRATKPKMGDRVEALETQMGAVNTTLDELVRQMQQHANQMQQQSVVLAQLSKQIGQKGVSNEGETSVNNSLQGESRLAGKKVKLPLFDGEDPVAWITRAEIYFDVQNTLDDMRVKLARLSMEGATIHWFNLLMETEDELSWEKLKRALIARYGGRRLENPFEELSTLRQKGSVEEFVEAFELLSSQVGRLPEDQYLGYFMSGLKPQIRRRVRTLNPRNRMEMMRIAKDVEEELKEEDDDVGGRNVKKGGYEKVGQKDWAGLMKNKSGYQARDQNRSFQSGGSNPNFITKYS
ncbi:retrotransposon gag protein, partial [Trifolium medium]|nr:retrotransposon gag protein [Trifolium medium]